MISETHTSAPRDPDASERDTGVRHPVSVAIDDSIGIVQLDHPPVNALSALAGAPQAIEAGLRQLDARGDVDAIVLCAKGRVFSAGADVNELRGDPETDVVDLRRLFAAMDEMSKPVIAAVHGVVFGGGIEVVLCAHYRIAHEDTRLGLPEVTLGLIPGGGGTQRLPRLVGSDNAAELIVSGRTFSAQKAMEIGLVDHLFTSDAATAGVQFARELLKSGEAPQRPRDKSPTPLSNETLSRLEAEVTGLASRNPGPAEALYCVRNAARLPFDKALAIEYDSFDALIANPLSQGLRHAFLSDRAATRIPGLETHKGGKTPSNCVVIGAGTMGLGISMACANAGLNVTVIDGHSDALDRARASFQLQLKKQIERGRMSEDTARRQSELLSFSDSYDPVRTAEIVIEAVYEDLSAKEEVFRRLDQIAPPGAVLASNTSSLDLNKIAAFTERPEAVVGMHFFSPANVMKLLEIVRADQTSDDTLSAAARFGKAIGKLGVTVGISDGFVGNRIMEEYLRVCYVLMEEGALPHQIDTALENWGWAMGPCKVMDLAGQDIGLAIRTRRAVEQPDRPYSAIPDLLCEKGYLGLKTGHGYYSYADGPRKPAVDPAVTRMIEEHSAKIGVERREVSDHEIVDRTLLVMINEGAKILEEGVASRPLEIDAIYLNGYGYGRHRGGPMFQADLYGIDQVVDRLIELAAARQGFPFEPADLLLRMRREGQTFQDLNQTPFAGKRT